MGQDLSGKVAIITGGASGLGRATVELFLKEGAKVVIADVDAGRGHELTGSLGGECLFKRTDVTNAQDVQALVEFAVERFGGVHVMVNNAGVSGATHDRFLTDDLKDFRRIVDVNLLGVMLGTQHAGRVMARQGGGSIINLSSIAAIKAGFGVMTYRAVKAAVVHFSKCVAIDLAEYGIRVNCIAPGHIRTDMTTYATPGMTPQAVERLNKALDPVMSSSRPLKRQGRPIDVAEAALYLASERSAQVTGVVLPVDGGVTAGDAVNHLQEILEARAKVLES